MVYHGQVAGGDEVQLEGGVGSVGKIGGDGACREEDRGCGEKDGGCEFNFLLKQF